MTEPKGTRTFKVDLPPMYPKQYDAIMSTERFVFIEASTKSGKTLGCIVWLLSKALEAKRGQEFWWVAPVSEQAQIAMRRIKMMLGPEHLVTLNRPPSITLPNGAIIRFKTGDEPDNLYGEDVQAAVIDEASRMDEDSWFAVRSTLTATRGPVRIIGNVKGRGNWFYKLSRMAEAGEPEMHYAKLTAYDAVEGGVLDLDEVESAKRQLPERMFQELYLATPADDGGNPFGAAAIEACVKPMSRHDPVCWGWDLAKSQDWTVGIALDYKGQVCRFQRFQRPWEETVQQIAKSTGAPGLIDATGVGDPIVERLQRMGVPVAPFKFTSVSKQPLMEGLAVAIQSGLISFPEGPITAELHTFEYEHKKTVVAYSAPKGLHDDCVCALALAQRVFERVGERARIPGPAPDTPHMASRPASIRDVASGEGRFRRTGRFVVGPDGKKRPEGQHYGRRSRSRRLF